MSVRFVPDGLDGERVDAAASRMTGLSRSKVAELIEAGLVMLDGTVVTKTSYRVAAGAMLDIDEDAVVTDVQVRPALADGLSIVYEDADLVVVDKPVGVAAHPTLGWDGPSVLEHLLGAGVAVAQSGAAERRGIVQRLDVGTSGLMVVAKSEHAYSVLKQAFRDRTIDKTYHALVQGYPDPLSGTIDAPIARQPGSEWKMAVVDGGRRSVTHYDTLEVLRSVTLLEVHLETGRTHQIRVHMAAIHHPCAGDPLYGADPTLARTLGLDRQWLHAVRLGLVHPGSGDYVCFESEYPDDLRRSLAIARDM